jgi:hypothetical protein
VRYLTALLVLCAACTDVRDATGPWQGVRVGDDPSLRVGVAADATATLDVTEIDKHGLAGTLTIAGVCDHAAVRSIEGAEADVLAGITFAGSPLRVYLAFAPTTDGGGDALAVIALYEGNRLEIRVLRGGTTPIYGVFALRPE